jgi:hypothetical protein
MKGSKTGGLIGTSPAGSAAFDPALAQAKDVRLLQRADFNPDAHAFVQFAAAVAVFDSRGMELLVDRVLVGRPVCAGGPDVVAVVLADGWFTITAGQHAYRVPVTNVRSARR